MHDKCAPKKIMVRPLSMTVGRGGSALPRSASLSMKQSDVFGGTTTRFGRGTTCPGCQVAVAVMERGVVQGPQGSRWHSACLVCGGKGSKKSDGRPGCGKRLDSAAKCDRDGGVWCRECLMLIPMTSRASPQHSPVRSPLSPNFTGTGIGGSGAWGSGRSFPRVESVPRLGDSGGGVSGLVRQFTGTAPVVGLSRQFTGSGAVSPVRPGSPVKQGHGGMPVTRQLSVRPKSALAKSKSVDLGRGMFLVRQMTGNGP